MKYKHLFRTHVHKVALKGGGGATKEILQKWRLAQYDFFKDIILLFIRFVTDCLRFQIVYVFYFLEDHILLDIYKLEVIYFVGHIQVLMIKILNKNSNLFVSIKNKQNNFNNENNNKQTHRCAITFQLLIWTVQLTNSIGFNSL